MTLLRGVGGGFFDDQDPKVLFNLGSAVVQPPTFTGTSSVGYAVTALGNLVRFDLDNPSAGASVVYSGQQVVAAQALTSGQVVVALADGVVDLLVPQGNGLSVGSQLLADGATPSLPSSIEVLAKANGAFRCPGQQPGFRRPLCLLSGRRRLAGGSDASHGRCDAAYAKRVPAPSRSAEPARRLDVQRDRHECQRDRCQHELFILDEFGSTCPRPPRRRSGYPWAVSLRSRMARQTALARLCSFQSRATLT